MKHTFIVAQKVFKQLRGDKRLLVLSIIAPLIIIYFLKIFMDTLTLPPFISKSRFVMPISAFIVHFLGFLLCAIALVRERTAGTLERMFISGIQRPSIIAGYVFGFLGLATIQAIAVLTEALFLFDLSYKTETVLSLFLIMWLLAIVSVMLGIFISTFARNEGQVFPFIPMIILPSLFLSGLMIDYEKLPRWGQYLGKFFPLHYANNVIQEIIIDNGSSEKILKNIIILIVYAIALLVIASRTLKEVE